MTSAPTVVAAYYGDIMLCYNGTLPSNEHNACTVSNAPYTYFAVNLNASKGAVGSMLWMEHISPASRQLHCRTGGVDPVNSCLP